MTRTSTLAFILAQIVALSCMMGRAQATQITWNVDNTTSIGGFTTTKVGSPVVTSTPFGNGLKFDGTDGVIVKNNPVAGLTAFTVEMIFRPDSLVNSADNLPRVLHIQSPNPPDDRITLEARIEDGQFWHTDAFLKVGATSNAYEAPVSQHHLLGQWYDYAMVYNGTTEFLYVNGQLEMSAAISVSGLSAGETSLGMRDNQINFFEGVIAEVRFTNSALTPDQLMTVPVPEPSSLAVNFACAALLLLTSSGRGFGRRLAAVRR